MQSPRFFIEPTGRAEIGQPELAAGILEPIAKYIERPAPLDLAGQAAQELLQAGISVFLEKPMCARADECQRLIELAAQRGVRVGVAVSVGVGLASSSDTS